MQERQRFAVLDVVDDANGESIEPSGADQRFGVLGLFANSLKLRRAHGRKIPQVDIGGKPQFSCTIVPVPANQNLGAQFLVRFNVNGNPVVTVRQKDVERLLCTSPIAGKAAVADLTVAHPTFRNVWLQNIPGTLGDIVKAP